MNILYISSGSPTFVRKDVKLLSERFTTTVLQYPWNVFNTPFNFIRQILYLVYRVNKIDIIIIMFAGYWSAIPVLFGKIFHKKVFIILGGTDCVSYPTINYGSLRKPILKKAIYFSIKHATCLLPVHESLIESTNTYYDNSKQGIHNHFKSINTAIRTVYNGYNPKVTQQIVETSNRIHNSFITVALVNNETHFVLKGIDLILECASEFPEANFTIIGISNEIKNKLNIPTNVNILPPISNDLLTEKYLQAEFVIHISISEGFPNALCEAMSFGCIPIISPVGAMPTITNNIGFTVAKRDSHELTLALRNAINLSSKEKENKRLQAHNQIINNFSEMKRISKLEQVIEEFWKI